MAIRPQGDDGEPPATRRSHFFFPHAWVFFKKLGQSGHTAAVQQLIFILLSFISNQIYQAFRKMFFKIFHFFINGNHIIVMTFYINGQFSIICDFSQLPKSIPTGIYVIKVLPYLFGTLFLCLSVCLH